MMPLNRRPYHNMRFIVDVEPKERIKIVVPYAIFFRNFEEIEHEFERGVFLPGVPYYCTGKDQEKGRKEIESVRTAAFVLVQEKLLDNTFVFTSLTFGTAFMY